MIEIEDGYMACTILVFETMKIPISFLKKEMIDIQRLIMKTVDQMQLRWDLRTFLIQSLFSTQSSGTQFTNMV